MMGKREDRLRRNLPHVHLCWILCLKTSKEKSFPKEMRKKGRKMIWGTKKYIGDA